VNFNDIQALIANGESKTIEYKKSVAELEKLGKAISGMLNTKGGHSFIGITDSKKIVGTEVNDSTKKKITEFCNHFDPLPQLEIDYVSVPNTDRFIIAIYCSFSKELSPFTFRGRAYIKTESGIAPMPSEKYKQLLLEHAGLSKAWETLYTNGYTINDLDQEEIIKTIKIGFKEERVPEDEYTENVKEILTHFDLLENDKLNNAAMALFAKKMPSDYSQCFMRMGRFIDETMDEAIDSKQIKGNAFQLLTEALSFVKRHIPISSRLEPDKFERIDEAAIPLLAVREAIINAIVHRDYSKREGDISLIIFNDYLEIHNIGHLYGGLTVDQLSHKHPSRRRNEKIAQVFFARGLIDRWGGGTRRIFRLCAEQGLPVPVFSEHSDGFLVKFLFKNPIGPQKNKKTEIELPLRQQELIGILTMHRKLTFKQIMKLIKNPPAERTVRNDLTGLRNKDLIASEGFGRAAIWYIKNK
jgi:ATP-dependent DNA helicase RecG